MPTKKTAAGQEKPAADIKGGIIMKANHEVHMFIRNLCSIYGIQTEAAAEVRRRPVMSAEADFFRNLHILYGIR